MGGWRCQKILTDVSLVALYTKKDSSELGINTVPKDAVNRIGVQNETNIIRDATKDCIRNQRAVIYVVEI